LLGHLLIAGAVILTLLLERNDLFAQLANLGLSVSQLLRGLVTRRARLRLDSVDLFASQSELFHELLVLGPILFELLTERRDLSVAAAG
jgi:hypothetical protein